MRLTLILSLFLIAGALIAYSGGSADFNPRLYPNPVSAANADPVNRLLHVDQADADSVLNVYNMIGEKIYSMALKGSAGQDTWNLVNTNGIQVVTGIYVVVIQSPTGKSSVQRIAILQ